MERRFQIGFKFLAMASSFWDIKIYGGSNYDSLIVRTVAFPDQVAYWI